MSRKSTNVIKGEEEYKERHLCTMLDVRSEDKLVTFLKSMNVLYIRLRELIVCPNQSIETLQAGFQDEPQGNFGGSGIS